MASAVSSPARVATNPSRLLSPRVARAAAAADTASRQRRLAGREVSSSGRRRASAWSASRANDDDDDDDEAAIADELRDLKRRLATLPPDEDEDRVYTEEMIAALEREAREKAARNAARRAAEARSIHWSPYDRVGVVNAVP
jgi:hypothetical protein